MSFKLAQERGAGLWTPAGKSGRADHTPITYGVVNKFISVDGWRRQVKRKALRNSEGPFSLHFVGTNYGLSGSFVLSVGVSFLFNFGGASVCFSPSAGVVVESSGVG